jgi:hypothetical protein
VEELGEERDVSGSITRSLRFINIQSSEHVRLKTRIHYITLHTYYVLKHTYILYVVTSAMYVPISEDINAM